MVVYSTTVPLIPGWIVIALLRSSCPLPLVICTSLIVTLSAVTLIVPCRSMFAIVPPGVPAVITPDSGNRWVPAGTPELVASEYPHALGRAMQLRAVPGKLGSGLLAGLGTVERRACGARVCPLLRRTQTRAATPMPASTPINPRTTVRSGDLAAPRITVP